MRTGRVLVSLVLACGGIGFARAARGEGPPVKYLGVAEQLGLPETSPSAAPLAEPLWLSPAAETAAPVTHAESRGDTTETARTAGSEPLMLSMNLAAAATEPSFSRPTEPYYRGGRGLITLQGMSGMFLNPTSGTLNQGQLTIQYCIFFNDYSTDVIGHGLMVDYGVTDWLDVGLFGTLADVPGRDLFESPYLGAGGPFARVRLLKEKGWIPELSVGGIYTDGGALGDLFAKKEVFVAGSKSWEIDRDGYLKSVRLHLGYRYLSRTEAPIPQDESYVYGGVEVELPYSFFLIGELSSSNLNERGDQDLPYAVGIQWKPNNVLGISIAHMNPSGTQPALKEGFWFGIGLNFQL
jgi:hypothetical protein